MRFCGRQGLVVTSLNPDFSCRARGFSGRSVGLGRCGVLVQGFKQRITIAFGR